MYWWGEQQARRKSRTGPKLGHFIGAGLRAAKASDDRQSALPPCRPATLPPCRTATLPPCRTAGLLHDPHCNPAALLHCCAATLPRCQSALCCAADLPRCNTAALPTLAPRSRCGRGSSCRCGHGGERVERGSGRAAWCVCEAHLQRLLHAAVVQLLHAATHTWA